MIPAGVLPGESYPVRRVPAVSLPDPVHMTWDDRSDIRNRYRLALSGYAATSLLATAPGCHAVAVRAESDVLLASLEVTS
jgi:hypothetical protein